MARTRRLSVTGALIVCLLGTEWSGTLFASGENGAPKGQFQSEVLASGGPETQMPVSARVSAAISVDQALTTATFGGPTERSHFTLNSGPAVDAALGSVAQDSAPNFLPSRFEAFAGQIYQGPPIPMRRRRDEALAAITIGAIASITGAAVLVYANRPECGIDHFASGCGYGTKVVGGAVLSGGIVGLFVGALMWR
jgi:hypothetical protein